MLAHEAAMIASGLLPFDPAFDAGGFADALTRPVVGGPTPLLVDLDRLPLSLLGWLSLVVLGLELRRALYEGHPVRALHLAAGSGRSLTYCRAMTKGRSMPAAEAAAWLKLTTGRDWTP